MELFEYIDVLNRPFDIFRSQNTHSPLHWHYYSEILYMFKGRIKVTCNEKSIILKPDDICYIYPLQLHEVTKVDDDVEYAVIKFDIHTIHIPGAYLQRMHDYFVCHAGSSDPFIYIGDFSSKDNFVMTCIDKLLDEYFLREDMYMLQIQADIFTILISIMRKCEKSIPADKSGLFGDAASFYHILEYIDTHSGEDIEIQKLADMCHMSYSHFARLFRENFGRSCKDYIKYIRLNKAEEMLIHSDFDISYIAEETGFFDSSHFIRVYKEWKGITPKQQRLLGPEAGQKGEA